MGNCWIGRKKKKTAQNEGSGLSSATFGSKSHFSSALELPQDPVIQEQMYSQWSKNMPGYVVNKINNNANRVQKQEVAAVQVAAAEVIDVEPSNKDDVDSSICSRDVARSQTRTPTLNSSMFDHQFKTPTSHLSDSPANRSFNTSTLVNTPQQTQDVVSACRPVSEEQENEAENSLASLEPDRHLKIRPMPTPFRDITNFTPTRNLETLFNKSGRPKRSESALKYCQEKRQRRSTCQS